MKISKASIEMKARVLPEICFEDQQLTSFAGLIVLQPLLERLDLKRPLQGCFKHLKISPIFGHGNIVMLLVVHLLLGYRRLQDMRYYSGDPMVQRVLGLKRLPNVSTVSRNLSDLDKRSVRGWWRAGGKRIYAQVKRILITADSGGSNGWRLRLWKLELQKLADQTGLRISVCHFPPGTSKWNKIEHRLFCFISSNWRGEPLRDYETIVNLIARTTTAKVLKVTCRLDHRKYPTGRKVSNAEMKIINLKRNKFHGEWNYMIQPRAPQ